MKKKVPHKDESIREGANNCWPLLVKIRFSVSSENSVLEDLIVALLGLTIFESLPNAIYLW